MKIGYFISLQKSIEELVLKIRVWKFIEENNLKAHDFSKLAASVLVSTMISSTVFAWGDLGHQTVGEIAQRSLSPKGKKLVQSILGHGPLAEAATFPDLVRSDSDYNEFSSFHFVEIDPRYKGSYDAIPFELREKRDANTLISGVPEKLFDGVFSNKFSRNQQMDLLRYLVHLVGDVHQPLHVGNGYDRGANWCNVKYKVGEGEKTAIKSTNLHSFWDSAMVEEVFFAQKKKDPAYKMPSWKGFKELADLIIADQKQLDTSEVKSAPATEWYKESQALHSKVYIDAVPTQPSEREYCMRLVKDEQGKPVVDAKGVAKTVAATGAAEASAEYIQASSEIIKAQIMKAGLRLAYVINDMAQKHYVDGASEYQSLKIKELRELLSEFDNTKAK